MPGIFADKFTHWDILVYLLVVVVLVIATRIVAPRYFDKVVAVFAVGSFIGFLLVLELAVESLSLQIVLILAALMAAYDFWLDAFASKKKDNGNDH
ncbi:MAG: hypothetical protein APF80_15330 [Alphaproteobacteria bacterium BRH_c36]|nr:MAG: hypothetical protein APF80_15330 [Alphaproteobacteria bacterium BRH_c36]